MVKITNRNRKREIKANAISNLENFPIPSFFLPFLKPIQKPITAIIKARIDPTTSSLLIEITLSDKNLKDGVS